VQETGRSRVSGTGGSLLMQISQLLYALHALRKGRLRPSVRNGSMAVLPMGEVSVGDVVSFWARSKDESLDMTRHSRPTIVVAIVVEFRVGVRCAAVSGKKK
jgi:hypothetical protein